MLEAVNVNQHFEKRDLFDEDASIFVKPQELTIVTGTNGGGKSTLLEALAMITIPDKGEIIWNGHRINNAKQASAVRNKHMSLLFSDFKFISQLEILENITLPVVLQGNTSYHEHLDFIIEDLLNFKDGPNPDLSLKHLIDKKHICKLSDGEKRMVSIARALIHKTPYLLADELLNGFSEDVKIAVMQRLLKYFHQQNMGVFMIEHWLKAKELALDSSMKVNHFYIQDYKLNKGENYV